MNDTLWLRHEIEAGADVLYLNGVWRLSNLVSIAAALRGLAVRRDARLVLDGSGLQALDTAAGFMLFRRLADAGCTAPAVSARGFDPRPLERQGSVALQRDAGGQPANDQTDRTPVVKPRHRHGLTRMWRWW